MSTFRLEPEHFHFEIRSKPDPASHDWHVQPFVKDRIAVRLSGANSVRTNPLGICASSKPFNGIVCAESCQPLEITGFPPDFNRAERTRSNSTTLTGRIPYGTRRNALPRGMAKDLGTGRHGSIKSSKIAGRFCYARKPFRDLVPECKPRKRG